MGELLELKRKILILTHINIVLFLFFTGCSQKQDYINLDYIKTPNRIIIISNQYSSEVEQLISKLEKLRTSNKKEDQKKVLELVDQIKQLNEIAMVEINDKDFINRVIEEIRKSKATVYKKGKYTKQDVMFILKLEYNELKKLKMSNISIPEYLEKGYIFEFVIFKDGVLNLPVYNEKDGKHISTIEVRISKEVVDYIKKIYNQKKVQN